VRRTPSSRLFMWTLPASTEQRRGRADCNHGRGSGYWINGKDHV
jgi:hypothetical protein